MKRFFVACIAFVLLALPATGDAPPLSITSPAQVAAFGVGNDLTGFWQKKKVAAAAGASLSFVGCTANNTTQTTYTFTDHATGTAAANRKTVVGVLAEDGAAVFSISSMTVGGSGASEIVDEDGTGVVSSGFYVIDNPSGTTSTIAVTFSEAITSGAAVCVWAAYGLAPSKAAGDYIADDDTGSGVMPLTVRGRTTGFITAVAASATAANTFTWAVATEQVDTGATNFAYSAAHMSPAGSGSNSVTADGNGGGTVDTTASAVSFIADGEPYAEFLTCSGTASATATITYTNHTVGVADANRKTVVGVFGADSATTFNVTSVTVGGASATEINDEAATGVSNTALYEIANDTGTSEDIVTTHSETMDGGGQGICVWAIYDVSTGADSSAVDDDTAGGNMPANVTVNALGVAVGICNPFTNVANQVVWSGLIERFDAVVASALTIGAADFHGDDDGDGALGACDPATTTDTSVTTAAWDND